jgi:hypothetical protein
MSQIKLSKFAALQFRSHCYPDAVSVVLPDMYLSMGQNQSITCYHSDKTDVKKSRHDDLGFARRPYIRFFCESACVDGPILRSVLFQISHATHG